MTASEQIAVFGEVLFDDFGDRGRVLGGAPFNVAWHLQALGQAPRFVSRIGRDEDGEAIRAAMTGWGMDTRGLQVDPVRATGRVEVRVEDGQPEYEILADRAYDAIDAAEVGDEPCAYLYHGTLALRSDASRNALEHLKAVAGAIVMDVNLRDPWWRREEVLAWADAADWVKLNEDELLRLSAASGDLTECARSFRESHALRGVVVTRGEHGAFAVAEDIAWAETTPGPVTAVVDTVGAGDAFAAVLIVGLARGWQLQETLERAQRLASLIVGCRGATVDDPALYAPLIEEWSL